MQKLASLYLAAKAYAHRAHHLTSGPSFFQDHEFFGDTYTAYDSAFDSVAERAIGTGEPFDHLAAQTDALRYLSEAVQSNAQNYFQGLQSMELAIQGEIEKQNLDASLGTGNLLQGLADDSEKRLYFIQQRMA